MSKSSFYGITAVVLVLAAGLVSVTAAKMDEQEYFSRALVLEARVNANSHSTSTATTTRGHGGGNDNGTSSKPTVGTDKSGIHNTDRKGSAQKYVLLTGTVKSISGSSFVLTARRNDYTINTGTTTTRLYDRVWASMPFSSMVVGHKVKAYGMVSGMTVNARIVRDLSFPVHTQSDNRASSTENR